MLTLKKRPNSPFWIARGTVNGRRVERSTRCRNKHDARKVAEQIERDLASDEIGPEGLRFNQAVAMYLTANPDIRFNTAIVRHFGEKPVSEINMTEMRRAANQLFPRAAPATIARHLFTPVKAILNNAADEELCQRPRFKSPKGGNKRTVFFLPEAADAMIRAMAGHPHPHFAVLTTFLFGQGSRMGETLNLLWEDVSLPNRFAILRDTKSGVERRLTLIDRTIAALSTIRPVSHAGPVFLRPDGNPYRTGRHTGGQIKYQWGAAAKAAKIDASIYTPHTCRHTWATWFYAQTRDVLRLKDEGGWSSGEWQRYTKLGTPQLGKDALDHGWNFASMGENRGKVANYA